MMKGHVGDVLDVKWFPSGEVGWLSCGCFDLGYSLRHASPV